jgi:MFS transporter, DHA1 family, multidrug resistance protein
MTEGRPLPRGARQGAAGDTTGSAQGAEAVAPDALAGTEVVPQARNDIPGPEARGSLPLGTVTLFALLFATIAFSTDAMLPALGAIAADLSPQAPNHVQLVLTVFILGMGLGTFVVGPLSDALGRRPVILGGIGLYMIAAAVAAWAPTLEVLLAARLVAGIGAAAPRIVTVAMVRDMFAGRVMAQVMSFIVTVFVAVPAVAPLIGAGLQELFGWRAIFWSFLAFGAISALWFGLGQCETLPPERRRPLRARVLWAAVREVMADRNARLCIAILGVGFATFLSFLTVAPLLFQDAYGRGAEFPLWFAGVALLTMASSFVNGRLVIRLGMRRLALTAYLVQVAGAAVMLGGLALELPRDAEFAVLMAFMGAVFFAVGLTFGNLNAIALERLGHIAGLAASVISALYTVIAVAIAVPVGLFYAGSTLPVAVAVLIGAGLSASLVLLLPREPIQPAHRG